MKDYSRLKEYVDAANAGGWGWKSNYERSLYEDGVIDWPNLAGHYSSLLNDALSLIPPGLMEYVMSKDSEAQ